MNTNTKRQRQLFPPIAFIAVCVVALNPLPLGSAARVGRSDATFNAISTTFNPEYNAIGNAFTDQYYPLLDNSDTRGDLITLYHPTDSLMSFVGEQFQGSAKIVQKFVNLPFQNMKHTISAVDTQPMFDGGVLVAVSGQFRADDDSILKFSQTFVLKQSGSGSFFAQHDIFRFDA